MKEGGEDEKEMGKGERRWKRQGDEREGSGEEKWKREGKKVYRADLLARLYKGGVSTEIPSTCVSIPS